jgi:lactoylglutathione lyase
MRMPPFGFMPPHSGLFQGEAPTGRGQVALLAAHSYCLGGPQRRSSGFGRRLAPGPRPPTAAPLLSRPAARLAARRLPRTGWVCNHPMMEMTLRCEIFPPDLDAAVDFYTRVLRFSVTKDQRDDPRAYISLQRGTVRIGAARRAVADARAARRPPAGVELVLEVDDVVDERDRVVAAGWPLSEDLQDRPWGLRDFRILDPAGYYLRITDRAK